MISRRSRFHCYLAMALAAFFTAGCGWVKEAHYLRSVPRELGVTAILYMKDEAWGFGPGGNETGVVVFDLPAAAADRVREQGLDYLRTFRCATEERRSRCYRDWHPTPPTGSDLEGKGWIRTHPANDAPMLGIKGFLDRYGFGIEVDPSVESAIDGAIASPGNFYAYGRGGSLILVVPSTRRVYLAYSG